MDSQKKEIGTLVVVVLKAQHLNQPSFYKQDPYAKATLSGVKKRTQVASKGGQHPVWDDELRFPVFADVGKDKVNRVLEVACYKSEQRGEDVLLGKGTVDIEETLKTGEFDDWVPLETSAGTRGEVYLEMTFYANSAPPPVRRPSRLSLSHRLAIPAQGRQSIPKISPSSRPGYSPAATERTLIQSSPTTGSQIPASLIPAHVPKSQTSKQVLLNDGAHSVVTVKHKDSSLPPLLANNEPPDVGPGKNSGLPAVLQPGGRADSKSMSLQNRDRVISTYRPPPEILPDQIRRTLSDTPALLPAPPLQPSGHLYSSEPTSMTDARVGLTPSIVAEEHAPLPFPTTLASTTQAHMQPNSPVYTPAPTRGYSHMFSPPQALMPVQRHYDTSPSGAPSSSHYQQSTQYPNGLMTSQPAPSPMYPQIHSTQPLQQQPSLQNPSPQPPNTPQPQHPAEQPYLPTQQQHCVAQQLRYHPQHMPYTQTLQPPEIDQQHNYMAFPINQVAGASQVYSQPPQPLAPPPPPIFQSQNPHPHPQPPHQPRPYLSSPPPPPPPHLFNQTGKASFITQMPIQLPASSQGPISQLKSFQQSVTPVILLHQPPATPVPSQVASNATYVASIEDLVKQNQGEARRNEAEPTPFVETRIVVENSRSSPEDITEENCNSVTKTKQSQQGRSKDVDKQEVYEERDSGGEKHCDAEMRIAKEMKTQEQHLRQQEAEEEWRREEEECRQEDKLWGGEQEEPGKRNKECRRWEEEYQKRTEEELRRKELEEYRKREEEEHMRQESVCRRREEEEHRRQAEECRRREERIQHEREEETHRHREAEKVHRKYVEEAEAEKRWQEELAHIRARAEQEAADATFARAQMEAEEAERQRQEEADLALVQQALQEAEEEERLARERRRQVEADMEVARREQAHEELLERKRLDERRKRMEEADRELARRLDMELNLGTDPSDVEDKSR